MKIISYFFKSLIPEPCARLESVIKQFLMLIGIHKKSEKFHVRTPNVSQEFVRHLWAPGLKMFAVLIWKYGIKVTLLWAGPLCKLPPVLKSNNWTTV